ncbi:MAG: DNA repair protein RadA [Propionibacteriaceae bacterium]|nr:DNA repair protein RadA [Propionibacteriaceae bacterium]
MAKNQKNAYRCGECGWTSLRWVGRCGECQQWGTVSLVGEQEQRPTQALVPHTPALPIRQIDPTSNQARSTGIGELDRVLGGGLVPGSVALLSGEPGVGKSTLLLAAAARWAQDNGPTLYITGEESAGQVGLRAQRCGTVPEDLYLAAETDLGLVLGHIEQLRPSLLVLDSVQTIAANDIDGPPGGVAQVKAVATALIRQAKQLGMPVVLVGHVTKDGSIAGPRTLEHLVDVVLSFEGDRHSGFRLVRAIKNRFGPADEIGCFELTDQGIVEVPDPSGVFTSVHGEAVSGTAVSVVLEGRRPLVTELQALVAPSPLQLPRRVSNGVDGSRLAMILAVLQRRARLRLHQLDVYVSTVGGARIADPAADLAIACAVASAMADQPMPASCIAIGEIGLAGELRRVADTQRRLNEAARLGVSAAVLPAGSLDQAGAPLRRSGIKLIEAPTLSNALAALGLRSTRRGGDAD